jgi:hypothetical protein
LLRRLERPAPPASDDLDLLAQTLGGWVEGRGSLLVVADLTTALDVVGSRLPPMLLGDLLTLSRTPVARAALISWQGVGALRRLMPFTDVICVGRDGREVEGGGLARGVHETPGAGWGRGTVVRWMRDQLAHAMTSPVKVLYLGASPADEMAFAELAGKAATVHVGPPPPRGSRATFRLADAAAARGLLTALARAAAADPATRDAAAS